MASEHLWIRNKKLLLYIYYYIYEYLRTHFGNAIWGLCRYNSCPSKVQLAVPLLIWLKDPLLLLTIGTGDMFGFQEQVEQRLTVQIEMFWNLDISSKDSSQRFPFQGLVFVPLTIPFMEAAFGEARALWNLRTTFRVLSSTQAFIVMHIYAYLCNESSNAAVLLWINRSLVESSTLSTALQIWCLRDWWITRIRNHRKKKFFWSRGRDSETGGISGITGWRKEGKVEEQIYISSSFHKKKNIHGKERIKRVRISSRKRGLCRETTSRNAGRAGLPEKFATRFCFFSFKVWINFKVCCFCNLDPIRRNFKTK